MHAERAVLDEPRCSCASVEMVVARARAGYDESYVGRSGHDKAVDPPGVVPAHTTPVDDPDLVTKLSLAERPVPQTTIGGNELVGLRRLGTIAVTAGASAPEEAVSEVVARLGPSPLVDPAMSARVA